MRIHGPHFQMDSNWQHDGSHLAAGYYFTLHDEREVLLDVAGPFDDEAACEMAMERAVIDV